MRFPDSTLIANYTKVIALAPPIPSLNSMYKNTRGGGRYLDPKVSAAKALIINQITSDEKASIFKNLYGGDNLAWGSGGCVLTLDIEVFLLSRIWARDTSNFIKFTEDAIMDALDINDRFAAFVSSRKYEIDNDTEAPKATSEFLRLSVNVYEGTNISYSLTSVLEELSND